MFSRTTSNTSRACGQEELGELGLIGEERRRRGAGEIAKVPDQVWLIEVSALNRHS